MSKFRGTSDHRCLLNAGSSFLPSSALEKLPSCQQPSWHQGLSATKQGMEGKAQYPTSTHQGKGEDECFAVEKKMR